MPSLRRIIRGASVYLLPIFGISILITILVDIYYYGNDLFIQPVLEIARTNEAALSVVISGLLLFAYILQFQSQHLQRKIMSRQEMLMHAGFTPILGVTKYEFGHELDSKTPNAEDKNRLFLDVINNGNSTARDLRIWFGVSYDGACGLKPLVRSKEVRLTREEEGSWWPADTGGALSNSSESPTRFVCDPKLKYRRRTCCITKLFDSYEEMPMHKALGKLEEEGIEEFRIAVVLKYKTTVGNVEEVPITGFKADPSKIGDDHLLYAAQEHAGKVKHYIRQAL